jgi:MTH538 TIR-like domain (DUF1863)
MARRVFFSFHYKRDVIRVSQVRNSWVVRADGEASPFLDAASWEEIKRKGKQAVQNWIDRELGGTAVTVVLIGAETANREFVKYEIKQSHELGKGLLGIYIHRMPIFSGLTDIKGDNPFANFYINEGYSKKYLSEIYPTYDWVLDDGYHNIGEWIEAAAGKA